MAIWNKLRTELDRAGRVAQGALDEGKLRLEVFRARQLVDRAAQALGYAVYRARTGLEALDEATLARLTDAVRARETELAELERQVREPTGRAAPTVDSAPAEASPPNTAEPGPQAPPASPSAEAGPGGAPAAGRAGQPLDPSTGQT